MALLRGAARYFREGSQTRAGALPSLLGVPEGLGLFTKAGLPGSAGTMPKQDFLWEAALAHRSAALAWDALVQREAAAAAAALPRVPGKTRTPALGPPALPPPPKALQDLRGPPEAPVPGAVGKANLSARLSVPKAPVQAKAMPAVAAAAAQANAAQAQPQAQKPKKSGRKSSHVRKRAPSEYDYETSVYYTSESEAPAEPAAGAAAEGSMEPGTVAEPAAELSAKPKPEEARAGPEREKEYGRGSRHAADGRGLRGVRISTRRERQPEKPRVRRTRKRRSSPHRRRKKTHPKGGRALEQQEGQQRSASKSCYRPGEGRARADEAKPGWRRELSQRGNRGSRSQGSTPRRGDSGGPAADRAYEDYVVDRCGKKGDGITLRRTMDLQDVDPDYCVHWGTTVSGRESSAGWLQLASGGYIPMDVGGTRLIRPARVRSPVRGPVRGAGRGGGAGPSGHAAEPGVGIIDDYIVYQGNKDGVGIGLRLSMDMHDLHPEHCITWGMEVRGRELPGGWLELASGGYIPMVIEGTRLVIPACLHEPAWSPPRGSRHRSRARSSGRTAQPGPGQQWGGKQRRQSDEKAVGMLRGETADPVLRIASRDAEGRPCVRASSAGPSGTQERDGNQRGRVEPQEGEDIRPYEVLWKIFCKYDDAYFREQMPHRLDPGWKELSPRQLKRQVCKWRKSQYRWRFPVEGGFRDYVLRRMPEKAWRKLSSGMQEGYWQGFHYDGQEPEESLASSPEKQPERSGGHGILRSRPRSRPKSVHRRISGLSPSEERGP